MDKVELIALAKELLELESLDDRQKDLHFLKRQYVILLGRDEDSYSEQELNNQFIALFEQLSKKEPNLLLSPYDEKKKIIESAKKLLEKDNVLVASKELDRLTDDFKKAGRCSKEQDDELWAEFREIKNAFYEKKRKHFEELDANNAIKRQRKEEIVNKAKEVISLDNIKEANAQMDQLRKDWKEVGYSGKGDDYLWKDFAKVLDEFQEKRKEHRYEILKTFEERANKKEELIKKAKKILADSDFSDEEVEQIKNLRGEFRNIGFAGKEKDDDLYQRFNEVIKQYFDEMKFYK